MNIPQSYLDKFQLVDSYKEEFELICKEHQDYFGKVFWSIPYLPIKGMTNDKIKKAAEIAKAKNIKSVGYLIGIIKKL